MPSSGYAPYADERTLGAEVAFELIDVDAATTAAVSTDAGTWFSEPEQTVDKLTSMSYKVATLEPNEWRLDGSYVCIKETGNGQVGYWSGEMSDYDGATDITCTYTFGTPQSSRAFTVIFDNLTGDCGEDFTLTAMNGGTQIATKSVTGNEDPMIIVDMPADGYTSLIIHVTKTNRPKRRVRLCEMVFGILQKFSDDKISSMELQYETTLDSQSLPSGMFSLTLDNTNREYNIINPSGLYRYLQQGQGLNVAIKIGTEQILMGRFYFDKAESDDNAMTVRITAYDSLYFMASGECNIGKSGTWTVAEAVAAIIADSGVGLATDIPMDIGARTVSRAIPQRTNHREALRMVAQASRCVAYVGRGDALTFVDISSPDGSKEYDELNNDRMADLPKITDVGMINRVIVNVRDEYADAETSYTAENIKTGDPVKELTVTNPLATSQEVANWLLAQNQYRVQYDVSERGNPDREVLDWVNIYDIYGGQKMAIVTKESFIYGLGLSGELTARTQQEG